MILDVQDEPIDCIICGKEIWQPPELYIPYPQTAEDEEILKKEFRDMDIFEDLQFCEKCYDKWANKIVEETSAGSIALFFAEIYPNHKIGEWVSCGKDNIVDFIAY